MPSSSAVTHEVNAVRVAILVRNEILCRGLEAVLKALPEVGAVRKCTAPDQAARLLPAERFEFVIVAAAEAEWLDTTPDSAKLLMLVDESAVRDAADYASIPVDGFLSQQDLSADTLREALHRCGQGELPMPPSLARALLARADGNTPWERTRPAKLTHREMEALDLLVRGMSNKQIARRLSISSHGAKRLVTSIMLKLDAANRTTAAVNAIKAGIIDPQGGR